MTEIIIQDDSGDKDFFTIIPNYIANHSTANDQALYFQMKRLAGEDGKCFATEKTLMKKLGIGKKAYDKSLNYLLTKEWISYIGLTEGKTRPIKTYKINNIWKLNNQEYRKIGSKRDVSFREEISAESEPDKSQKQHKISAKSNVEEEPGLIKTNKEELAIQGIADSNNETNYFIELFKDANPAYKQLFKDRTQRACLNRLLELLGGEKLEGVIKTLSRTNGIKFAPTITTPYELEKKLGSLIAFVKKEQSETFKNKIIRIK